MAGKRVVQVECGDNRTFCVISGEKAAKTVGEELLSHCINYSERKTHELFEGDDNIDHDSSFEVIHQHHNVPSMCFVHHFTIASNLYIVISPQDWYQNYVDCAIVASGKRFYCHKVIVAHRSPLFKALIDSEEIPGKSNSMIEIMIPDIHFDVLKSLLHFIYTDSLSELATKSFAFIFRLRDAANRCCLQRLRDHCDMILAKDYNFVQDNPVKDEIRDNSPSSYAIDIGKAFEEQRWTDVQLYPIDGKPLRAHQCILYCSCPSFRSILKEKMVKRRDISIPVNMTYAQLLRLLLFLYTGILANDGNQQDVMEDILTAENYSLSEMKVQCEQTIKITPQNAPHILQLALRVKSCWLKENSMNMISTNLKMYYVDEELSSKWKDALASCPMTVKEEFFEKIKDMNGVEMIVPKYRVDRAKYLIFLHRIVSLESIVPIINSIFFAMSAVYLYQKI